MSLMRRAITCSLFEPYQRETRCIYAMLIDEDTNFTGWKIGDGLAMRIIIIAYMYITGIHLKHTESTSSVQINR